MSGEPKPKPSGAKPKPSGAEPKSSETKPKTSGAKPKARSRRLPLVLICVATLVGFLALFAIWANRQLLDTDSWTDTSSELLENEAVRGQVATFLVDEFYANVDVRGELEQALPPRAAPLAGPAAGAFRSFAERAANVLLSRPRTQAAWEEANRRAHALLIQVVEGGGENLSTENGEVTLDLKSLLMATGDRVGLSDEAAAKLPADAGQLTLLKSDELEFGQDLVNLLQALDWILLFLTLALFGLAIYLARGWRREALRACGFGFAFIGALALAGRSVAGGVVVDALAGAESVKPAIQATWDIGTSMLQEAAGAALAYGIVAIAAAWLAGPTGLATATRKAMAPYLREPGYAYGALAVIVLGLIAWGPTPAFRKPFLALLLIALMAGGMEALRRQTAKEFPDASIEESRQRSRDRLASISGRFGGAPASGESDKLRQLEQLGRLHDSGVLEDAEFEREKAQLLAGAPAGTG